MALNEDTTAMRKPASEAVDVMGQPALGLTSSLPSFRMSQSVFCNLLSGFEALFVGAMAAWCLGNCSGAAAAPADLSLLSAGFVAVTALFFAVRHGAASYEGFASRRALFPGAVYAGAFTGIAAGFLGAPLNYIALCAAGLFVSVYIAKIPSLLMMRLARKTGIITRFVGIAAEDPWQRDALAKTLRDRDDIRIVFSGSPAEIGLLRDMTRDNCLDEIILPGSPPTPENLPALAGLAVTLVRISPADKFEHWSGGLAHGKHVNRWNAPAAIIAEPPLRDWNVFAKRVIDISGSLTALILLSPVMLACAIAIKLESKGPVLFVQQRAGYRTKQFGTMKFRSMYTEVTDKTGSQLTLRNDPRVTRVGNFLRRTSADELPQLFNVLMGHMSLVGPRPHPKGAKAGDVHYDDLIPEFYSRYRMKPGITGLAQISGFRGNTETEQHLISRFHSDLQYAAEWTPLLDIVILARTVVHVCKGTNAF